MKLISTILLNAVRKLIDNSVKPFVLIQNIINFKCLIVEFNSKLVCVFQDYSVMTGNIKQQFLAELFLVMNTNQLNFSQTVKVEGDYTGLLDFVEGSIFTNFII